MLIRILKKSKDMLEGKPHALNSEMTRRSFLQDTVTGVGSLLVLPSFISMLKSNPAKAAAFTSSFAALGTTYTQYCAGGGLGTSRIAFAWGMDGLPLVGDSTALGTRPNDPVDTATIPGIYLNGADVFAMALKSGGAATANGVNTTALFSASVTNEILSKLSGSQIACAKNDDTDSNPINVMMLFGGKTSMRKGLVADVGGDSARDRSISGLRNDFSVLRYGGDVNNLINAASLESDTVRTAAMGESVRKAVAALSAEQKAKLSGRVGAETFSANLLAGMEAAKGKFDPTTADIALNPANPVNAAIFTSRAPLAPFRPNDRAYHALIDAAAKQNFGAVNIVEGGFDYHNNDNDNANERHVFLARFILLWAWVHVCRGVNGVLQIDTDGGIAWDQDAQPKTLGDRGSSGQSLFIHVQGRAGAKPSFKRQGYYTDLINAGGGESASRDPLVGKRPEMSSIACVLTFGQLTGLIKSTDGSIKELYDAINSRGTVVPSVNDMMSLSMMA